MTPPQQRAALVAAHREGDLAAAVAAATELARAGWWDRLVAATLVAHGPDGELLTDHALVELTRMESVRLLADDAGSDARWRDALAALVAAGRADEAITGVRLASAEGRISAAPWKMLVALLLEAGHYADAIAATRLAVSATAGGEPELLALTALLACECDSLDEAGQALDGAAALAPEHPMVWVARGRLAAARGDDQAACTALARAQELGAEASVVDWLGRLGRVSHRHGL